MTTQTKKYIFSTRDNGPFMGRDGHVTRAEDGKQIRINVYDGTMAVNVKDNGMSWGRKPDEIQVMMDDLGDENLIERLYEEARSEWWRDADDISSEYGGLGAVEPAGRSGGWATVEGTWMLVDDFCTTYEGRDDVDPEEMTTLRDSFLDVAFALVESMGTSREFFYQLIRDEHGELERRREACITRGYN